MRQMIMPARVAIPKYLTDWWWFPGFPITYKTGFRLSLILNYLQLAFGILLVIAIRLGGGV